MQRVEALAASGPEASGGWPWARVLEHCAQSIEYSMDGFPKLKPGFIRATVGRIVAGRFLSRGALSHDLQAAIPGAPALTEDDASKALARLQQAVERFEAHDGALADHFIFGRVQKADYDHLHAMHIENHLSAFA